MANDWENVKRLMLRKGEPRVITDLKLQHGRTMDMKDEELRKAQRRYQVDMSQKDYEMDMKERQLRAEMEQQETSNAKNIEDLHARYSYENIQTTEMYERKMRELEAYLNSVTSTAKNEKQQAKDTIKRMNAEHADTIEKLNRNRDAREDELVADHKQRTQRLQEEVAQINAALLTRDDEIYQARIFNTSGLPRSPDDKIREQFTELQQMVEGLSRLQWKAEQKLWTDEILEDVLTQQHSRQLKKAILQDVVWTLLFHYVFCTPFRIFGDEASGTADRKGLEQEWNEQCGEDPSSANPTYTWPAPTVQAERWRYMTIKECRETLAKPVPSQWDPRARLKAGFKRNLDGLVDVLKQELGNVVDLAISDTQLIERLAKRSTATWLEFQMHRCRIVIQLTGSGAESTPEKIDLLQSGSLALTTSPWLGRHGNVNGVELESFTMISKGAGDQITLP